MFWSHVQSWPAPMKLAPKHKPLIALVVRTATHGTLFLFSFAKNIGACLSTAREYIKRVPANKAWLPAEITEVIIIALIKDPAALEPAIWKTRVNGEVEEPLVDSLG